MGRKVGDSCAPFFWGGEEVSTHLTQCRLGRGLPSHILIPPAIWPQQTWAEKGGCVPFRGGGTVFSSNTPTLQTERTESGAIA